ncbi:MAG: hypothetical protein K2Y27_23905 [Xanthobacteraceae bacterium]|nr:hypothetical protein [Xanthobacteraceae bacterium]
MTEERTNTPVTVTREELYQQVWSVPMQRLAAQYCISGNGLAKICDRLDIPYPPRGYWNKKAAGKPVRQLDLAAAKTRTPHEATIRPTPSKASTAGDACRVARGLRQGLDGRSRYQRARLLASAPSSDSCMAGGGFA